MRTFTDQFCIYVYSVYLKRKKGIFSHQVVVGIILRTSLWKTCKQLKMETHMKKRYFYQEK